MDRFRELSTFVAVAEEGAFNAAARRLNTSPPAVTRLVNALEADGLVVLVANPAHKRSRLVELTDAGRELASATARREAKILPEISRGIPVEDIRTATQVLSSLKGVLEGETWKELVGRG